VHIRQGGPYAHTAGWALRTYSREGVPHIRQGRCSAHTAGCTIPTMVVPSLPPTMVVPSLLPGTPLYITRSSSVSATAPGRRACCATEPWAQDGNISWVGRGEGSQDLKSVRVDRTLRAELLRSSWDKT